MMVGDWGRGERERYGELIISGEEKFESSEHYFLHFLFMMGGKGLHRMCRGCSWRGRS